MKENNNTTNAKNPGTNSDKTTELEEQAKTELNSTANVYSSIPSVRSHGTLRGYNPSQILTLQRTLGNKAVQRMVERTRQSTTAQPTSIYPKPFSTLVEQPANSLSHPVQRLMTLAKFKDKSDGAFAGKRNNVTKVDTALIKYHSATSKSVGLSEVIGKCDEYLNGPDKKDSSRVAGVKALKKEATNELAAWRLRARIPLPASVYRNDERTPEKIAEVGFQPWNAGGNVSIVEHVKQVLEADRPDAPTGESGTKGMGAKKHSQWVSTAGDLNYAKDPTLLSGLLNKYFYKIDTRNDIASFHDSSKQFDELGIPNPYESQFEFCKEGGIPGNQVSHFVHGKALMNFVLAGTDAATWDVPWEPMPVHAPIIII